MCDPTVTLGTLFDDAVGLLDRSSFGGDVLDVLHVGSFSSTLDKVLDKGAFHIYLKVYDTLT